MEEAYRTSWTAANDRMQRRFKQWRGSALNACFQELANEPSDSAVIMLLLTISGIAFLRASPRDRSLLAPVVAFSGQPRFGSRIRLNLPVLLSLLSTVLLVCRKVPLHPRCVLCHFTFLCIRRVGGG